MVLDKRQVGLILADETLGKIVSANLREISRSDLIEKPIDELSPQDFSDLRDEVIEVWSSHSKVVREYIAQQDKGPYPVAILGLPGAYFVLASEYPNSDCFESLVDAEAYVEENYGKYLI
jgi:ribosomal protein S17E